MLNVYDCANELARAIRESHELTQLKAAKAALDKDADGKKMVDDFLKLSQEVEIAKYQGQEVDMSKQDKLQQLYTILSLNDTAQSYLNAFMRFQMMMGDISKAISEPVKGVLGE